VPRAEFIAKHAYIKKKRKEKEERSQINSLMMHPNS
jgi:hypothetical protein